MTWLHHFMGRPMTYWLELQERLEKSPHWEPRIPQLLTEIRELRGKVSFYESRVLEMHAHATS